MKRADQTRMQIAAALKELVGIMPFRKISVSDIADRAGMSRKSFYYHFKDKYDLVARTFDGEFLNPCKDIENHRQWFEQLCRYLCEEREFYCSVLEYDGQNSFEDYLGNRICERVIAEWGNSPEERQAARFVSDAVLAMIKRWLTDYKEMDAAAFLQQVQRTAEHLASAERVARSYRRVV